MGMVPGAALRTLFVYGTMPESVQNRPPEPSGRSHHKCKSRSLSSFPSSKNRYRLSINRYRLFPIHFRRLAQIKIKSSLYKYKSRSASANLKSVFDFELFRKTFMLRNFQATSRLEDGFGEPAACAAMCYRFKILNLKSERRL